MIRPITKDDYSEIFSWYRDRGLPRPNAELLPPRGFIYPGVAAGFMIRCDNNIAFLEFFISNPSAMKYRRVAALNRIAKGLIEGARQTGIMAIYALTDNKTIRGLCDEHGFKISAQKDIYVRTN